MRTAMMCLLVLSSAAWAQTNVTAKSPPTAAQLDTTGALFWFDGEVQRPLFADPKMVAEVHPSEETRALILAADPGAAVVPSRGLRLWKLSGTISSTELIQKSSNLLPVMRDQASGAGKARVAAGDVVIQLEASRDVAAFLRENGLEKKNDVGALKNAFVVSAPAGYDAIRLANRVHGLPGVKLAMPNWWVAAKAK